jgi:hypothetical protein
MKKIIALTWLLICLLPLTVKAEEPVKAPAGEGLVLALSSPQEERPVYRPSLQELREGWEKRLYDDELDSVMAAGFDAPPPEKEKYFSRIILWDEVSAKPNQTGGLTVRTSGR